MPPDSALFRLTDRLVGRLRPGRDAGMVPLAAVIGLVAGLGAAFFRWLIETFQDLAWGEAATPLAQFAESPAWLRLAVPAVGGLLVGLIVRYVAPETRGHGVPEVMHAVARRGGVIRPVVALAKSVASAISIATGGAVGREGPIVQIGSALGSTFGQRLRLSARQVRTCVGCGAAAGIAATFNAPIAGAFFAAEVILGEFGVGAFSAIVVSSVSATVVARSLLGDVPAFVIPQYSIVHPAEMLTYAVLGLLAGVAAVAFVRVLHACEDGFERLRGVPEPVKPLLGGLAIGAIGLAMPEVMGVGYDTITDVLRGEVVWTVLVALLVVKLLATSLTLGSGGSGGVFAPSLFMGAALGGGVGHLARAVFGFPMASPGAYAVVGMGAMVAAATHAPITAILIIFELTGDYRVILGLMASCVIGTLVAQKLQRDSIYTIKLTRRGVSLRQGREVNVLRQLRVADVVHHRMEVCHRSATLDQLARCMAESPHYEFVVVDDDGALVGAISMDELRRILPHRESLGDVVIAEDLATQPVLYLREDDTLDRAMRQFGHRTHEELPVLPAGESMVPIGVIGRQDVINAYNKEMLRSDLAGEMSERVAQAVRVRTWETVGDFVLTRIEAPPHLCDHTVAELRLPQSRGLQIILVQRDGSATAPEMIIPDGATRLEHGDHLLVFGRRRDIDALVRESG
jgi:CIC family chloride channel protein